LNAPTTLTRGEYTTPAAVRRSTRRFLVWRIGWKEGRSVSSKNDAELSEIIMEINDLRRVACDPNRPEQHRRRFYNRAFRR
jgi:hypothetical protein